MPNGEKRIPITQSLGGNIKVQVYSIKGNQPSMCIANEDTWSAVAKLESFSQVK
jgi:hypothetical protein